jgi:class 3 adenylate cyclase
LKGNVHLGGEEKKGTMLFADIRGFTSLTQKMSPKEVIELLNACMTRISHLVDDYGGVIDKYVGDEAMALYGIPLAKEESALQAVLSAVKMVESLKEWNQERTLQGLSPVEMGIGIHTGSVFVGNMGAENRLNYTVIGRNVNFAERLCALAKGMEILISEQTYAEKGVKEQIAVEKLSDVSLKGFDKTFIVYRVFGTI